MEPVSEYTELKEQLKSGKDLFWKNPKLLPVSMTEGVTSLAVSEKDIEDAADRLRRFAPYIAMQFPETAENHGLIESPLREIPAMQKALEERIGSPIPGKLYIKLDSDLPIAGSVKARGGIYAVLCHAEHLCIDAGLLSESDDYTLFTDPVIRHFLSLHTIQVSSTGNLGLSIGIMSRAMGFHVIVHMSADARQWKKDLLRSAGAEVIEYADDYSSAVAEGRKKSESDPMSYFIDDEKSKELFLGYAVAASRLHGQLLEKNTPVDENHPLIVYCPAGVGGAPGGISYGLKKIYGDSVHCFFTEPAACPSVTLGIASGLYEKISVHDIGLSGKTEADGLACARPSSLVTRLLENLVSGSFTVQDGELYEYLRMLDKAEQIFIEPSSCAVFSGPAGLSSSREAARLISHIENATQIVWATGGSMVPADLRREYLQYGLEN